jgi:hypothetical protein
MIFIEPKAEVRASFAGLGTCEVRFT